MEQHGPHLPLFLDAEHGTHLAEGIARRLGDALVAPTIRLGCSEGHMGFPGTISLRRSTFEPLAEMLEWLRDAAGPDAQVHAFTDMSAVLELWRRVAEEECGLGAHVGGHADIAESSIMLALHPELVQREAAEAGYVGSLTPDLVKRMGEEGIHAVMANGVRGDPHGMSASMGRRCIEAYVDLAVSHFLEEG